MARWRGLCVIVAVAVIGGGWLINSSRQVPAFVSADDSQPIPKAQVRNFRSADGKSVRGRVVSLNDTQITILSPNGNRVTLDIAALSEADQTYVARLRGDSAPAPADNSNAAAVTAQRDWHQWRGPRRDGQCSETGLNDEWPADGPPILWRTRGLGAGMSTVAIWNDRLYTMGKSGGQTVLTCRSLQDGSEQWTTAVGGGDNPNCTPTVDPDSKLVFALSHGGDLLCADADSGREVWRKNFERDFGGRMMSGWGYSESPLVDGDRLICTPGSERALLAALDKRTGETIWTTPAPAGSLGTAGKDGAGYSSIVISNAGGIKQYVQLVGRGVVGVAADNGRGLWNYNRVANGTANIPTPIVTGNYVFTSTGYGDGGTALLELSRSGRGISVREVYYKPANDLQNHHGGMVLVGDYVYLGHGHNNGFPACVELKTGRNVWGRTRGAGSGSAAVLYADGDLYFRYQDGTLALIEATPKGYNLKRSFRIATRNGESWPHPVIQDGKLYLRDQDELLCYDLRSKST